MIWYVLGLLASAAVLLVISKIAYRLTFYYRKESNTDPYALPKGSAYTQYLTCLRDSMHLIDSQPYEQVFITSHDGLRLAARFYKISEDAPVQILFHGFQSHALRDMCGGTLLALDKGYNVLLVDQRAHGASDGRIITFGIEERQDCIDWIQYITGRFGQDHPIFLVGLSMGAATVLMASDRVPKNVRGIIADCPYDAPGKIIRKVCRDIHIPAWLLYPFIVLGGVLFGNFRIWDGSAVQAVRHTRVPILLLHGDADSFVPASMSKKIQQSNPEKVTLVLFSGAEHGLSYMADSKTYEQAVTHFLNTCLRE